MAHEGWERAGYPPNLTMVAVSGAMTTANIRKLHESTKTNFPVFFLKYPRGLGGQRPPLIPGRPAWPPRAAFARTRHFSFLAAKPLR
jgi:hypothetical protein